MSGYDYIMKTSSANDIPVEACVIMHRDQGVNIPFGADRSEVVEYN